MKVVITDAEFTDLSIEREVLEPAGFEVVVADCRAPEEVVAAAQDASALIVQYAPITRQVIDQIEGLGIVSRYGVGVDSVDVDAATRAGIWVANVPDYGTGEVAAHTVAMLLSLVRHLPAHDRLVRDGVWDFSATGPIERLSEMTLGLLGLGRIGRMVAERAGSWFGRVVAFDPFVADEHWPEGVDRMERDDVVRASQVLSLHLPLTDETSALVDRRLLDLVSDSGLYLVNTSRGGLVDLDDLITGLDAGHVRGAALDVLPEEPPGRHPILGHPRVLLSPHAAWYSESSEVDMRRMTAENVVAWRRHGRPTTAVNAPGPAGG